MGVMRLDRGVSWLELVVCPGTRPGPLGRKRSEYVKQGWKAAYPALNCQPGRLACARIRDCCVNIARTHCRCCPPTLWQRPSNGGALEVL